MSPPPLQRDHPGRIGALSHAFQTEGGKTHRRPFLPFPYVLSTPFFAHRALSAFEGHYIHPAEGAQAIVVLGSGSYLRAPEYGGINTISENTLERVRYAAFLYRKTGKPILVTGGHPLGNRDSEASQMKAVLENEFHVPVSWMEDQSNDTEENATLSFAILKKQGITRIYLVTHAWHMRRASLLFRDAGFTVVPAATRVDRLHEKGILAFLPSAKALLKSELLMHELIGICWFELKSNL
jgi:uncharacterized SAM-binding protein YcdF (DUF218 family)